ncbi:hypothetical protein F3J16_13270 [Burkholderia sp. Ap-962]|uniref:hypothetical protein n=1 Tax=Burkholderia sp. Ap-962 TaxID=2608333 RepID=UPI00142109DC|nr:hypothetical protein [Burkholderia sp. Ap-962]NIF71150.1 hypothetical protein [Burkholderia sp. Ap-962]
MDSGKIILPAPGIFMSTSKTGEWFSKFEIGKMNKNIDIFIAKFARLRPYRLMSNSNIGRLPSSMTARAAWPGDAALPGAVPPPRRLPGRGFRHRLPTGPGRAARSRAEDRRAFRIGMTRLAIPS